MPRPAPHRASISTCKDDALEDNGDMNRLERLFWFFFRPVINGARGSY